MEGEAKKLKGQATEEQIAKWKKDHGEIFAVSVDGSICYLKKPNRNILSAMSTLANDPIRSAEFLLNNCWLDGDTAIKDEDDKFLGVVSQLGEIIKVKTATLVKL